MMTNGAERVVLVPAVWVSPETFERVVAAPGETVMVLERL